MTTNNLRAAVAAGLLAALGCSGGDAKVGGTVTLDGQPVKNGTIQFVPADGDRPTAGAAIRDGAYRVVATPGRFRVTVSAPEVVGRHRRYEDQPDGPFDEDSKERLPKRYTDREKTELTVTLTAGPNEANFDLTSDPAKK